MLFFEKYLELHRAHYSRFHSFPSTAIAALCLTATDQKRKWRIKDIAAELNLTYAGARVIVNRLQLEGLLDRDGRITAEGLNAAGSPPPGQ